MSQKTQDGFVFTIIDEVEAKYPELVTLVLATESMDNSEKQYWFDILPSMTDDQIDRLQDILETEKRKLEELDAKYQEEIRNLNEKHLIEWQEFPLNDSELKDANGRVVQAGRLLFSKWENDKVAKLEEEDKKSDDTDDILDMLKTI